MDRLGTIFNVGSVGTEPSTVTIDGLTVSGNEVPLNEADQQGWTAVQSSFGSSVSVRDIDFQNNRFANNLFYATEDSELIVNGGNIANTTGALPLVSNK